MQIDEIARICAELKPLVVISCFTYNHEPYLRDALEGFVMQKADFPFVAVVHEDASTDGTAAILREYACRYPDIILPIFETENQYSRKDGSLGRIMSEACKATGATFIAFCEGDDYWTDPLKLQKQAGFMKANPDCSMCFTNSIIADGRIGQKDRRFDCYIRSRYASMEDLITRGGGFCATATLVVRRDLYESIPDEVNRLYVGDYPLQMYMGYIGRVYYLNEITTVYRYCTNGSWSQKFENTTFENLVSEYWPKNEVLFDTMDKVTEYKYSALMNSAKAELKFWGCMRYGRYIRAISLWPKVHNLYRRYGIKVFLEMFSLGLYKAPS